MTDMISNAVTAKIHAIRSNRITAEQYRNLASKKSLSEIVSYLQTETRYSDVLSEVQPHTVRRGQLENLLREYPYIEYAKLMRYIPKAHINYYRFCLLPAEIEQILRMIRLINNGTPEQFALQFPRYIVPYTTVDFDKLSKAEDFDGLIGALRGTKYSRQLEPYRPEKFGKIDYALCDTALFTHYYSEMYEIIDNSFKSRTKWDLNKMFGVSVQLRNTTILYRLKRYFPEIQDVGSLLVPMRNRTARREIRLLAASPDAGTFIREVMQSQFGKDFSSDDFDHIELREGMINYSLLLKSLMRNFDAPVCFTSFIKLITIEVNNVITIAESVYYNLPFDETWKLLVV